METRKYINKSEIQAEQIINIKSNAEYKVFSEYAKQLTNVKPTAIINNIRPHTVNQEAWRLMFEDCPHVFPTDNGKYIPIGEKESLKIQALINHGIVNFPVDIIDIEPSFK